MELLYSYWYFKSALSPEICQKIIDLGIKRKEEHTQKGESTVAITGGRMEKQSKVNAEPLADKTIEELGKDKDFYVRDSEVSWLKDDWLYQTITPYLSQANKNAGWNFDIDYHEVCQFTIYKPGGFYGWHSDGDSDHFGKIRRWIPGVTNIELNERGEPPYTHSHNDGLVGKVRKLSMTINLNMPGEYEGGNLKFDFGPHAKGDRFHECEEIRPQGSIIVFPSFIKHQVTPITTGTRYSLVLWSNGKPFR